MSLWSVEFYRDSHLQSETVNGDAASQRKDKKGNPLEFLQLLTSLTKRW